MKITISIITKRVQNSNKINMVTNPLDFVKKNNNPFKEILNRRLNSDDVDNTNFLIPN